MRNHFILDSCLSSTILYYQYWMTAFYTQICVTLKSVTTICPERPVQRTEKQTPNVLPFYGPSGPLLFADFQLENSCVVPC